MSTIVEEQVIAPVSTNGIKVPSIPILILEDNEIDVELILQYLEKASIPFESKTAHTKQTFLKELKEHNPSIIFSDYTIPGFGGMEALKIARELKPKVPFIFVSGTLGEENAVDAMKEGALDYVLKDNLKRLPISFERALSIIKERDIQRKTEDDLKRKNYSIERSFTAIAYSTLDGKLTYVNRSFLGLWKYEDKNEVLGKYLNDFHTKKSTSTLWKVLKEENLWMGQVEAIAADGSQFIVQVSATVIQDDAADNSGYIMYTFLDITEKYESINKLKASEEKLNFALTSAKEGLWEWHITTNTLTLNDLSLSLIEYEARDVGSSFESFMHLLHPEDHQKTNDELQRHLKGQSASFRSEFRIKTKKGNWKWMLCNGRISRVNEAGEPTYMIGTFLDIDIRKRSEAQLQESQERLRLAIEASNKGLWDWYAQTDETYFSPEYFEILGYKNDEFKPSYHKWISLIHQDDREGVKIRLREHLEGKTEAFSVEHRMFTKDKSIKWIYSHGKVVRRTSYGTPLRIVGVIRDISEEKANSEKIISTILETEDRERSRISKEIHDGLGQNLNAAFMNLDIAKRETHKLSEKVQKRIQNAMDLVKMSVEESRLIAHNLMPPSINSDLPAALENLVSRFEGIIPIELDIDKNVKELLVDKEFYRGLYRIIQEGINNAIKHAQADRLNISIGIPQGYELILEITDNGKGFDPEIAEKGLGLNSMNTRAKSLSGMLKVISKENKGTTIKVKIPV